MKAEYKHNLEKAKVTQCLSSSDHRVHEHAPGVAYIYMPQVWHTFVSRVWHKLISQDERWDPKTIALVIYFHHES